MGIGMALVVPKKQAAQILAQTKGLLIGEIVEGAGDVVLV
jgi:phosphoribosylaminoimidazole (AIR) synthetase